MDALLEEKTGASNSLDIIRKPFITSTENNPKTGLPQSQLDINPERRELVNENDVIAQLFEYDSTETAGSLVIIFYLTAALTALSWLSSFFICQFANVTPPPRRPSPTPPSSASSPSRSSVESLSSSTCCCWRGARCSTCCG
jgi:hypothetical protein